MPRFPKVSRTMLLEARSIIVGPSQAIMACNTNHPLEHSSSAWRLSQRFQIEPCLCAFGDEF